MKMMTLRANRSWMIGAIARSESVNKYVELEQRAFRDENMNEFVVRCFEKKKLIKPQRSLNARLVLFKSLPKLFVRYKKKKRKLQD